MSVAPASAARLVGKITRGVYTSPKVNFTVMVPNGTGMRVNDALNREEPPIGVVSFHDDFGANFRIFYMQLVMKGQALEPPQDPAEITVKLEGWIREVVIPNWFAKASPDSRVIRIAPTKFDDRNAVVALLEIPNGSALMDMVTNKRLDSRLGAVAFFRDGYVYLITMETRSAFDDPAAQTAEPGENWARVQEAIVPFYRTINFK